MAFLAPEVRLSIPALRIVWIVVFMSHAVVGFLLYRWRVLSRFSESSLAGSDWMVFGVPFWFAFGAYFIAFTFSPYLRPRSVYRYVGLAVLSFAGAFFCCLFYMLFAVNIYGT
jgi:hypothetical protein